MRFAWRAATPSSSTSTSAEPRADAHEGEIVRLLEEGYRVVLRSELGDSGREAYALRRTRRARADRELDSPVELEGVLRACLGQDHGELVAADPAHDVGLPDGLAQALGDGRQDGVPRQMAQRVVRRLEVVDVEDDERDASLVAVGARAFALEG